MAARHDQDASHHPSDSLPVSPINDSTNVFSDDYAESLAEDYADSQDGMSIRRSPSIRSLASERRQSVTRDPELYSHLHSSPIFRTHNSISKSRSLAPVSPRQDTLRDPFADNADEPSTHTPVSEATPRNSGYATTAHRSLSTSSFAGSQSPASIHEGPSHPYAMYPQALSMSRTPSVATASTRPLSMVNSGGHRGPTHPYDSFTQNVAGDAPLPVQSSIPVGFPGANNESYRRVGPEGEEQDIIGADGHAEQLPPYSRYPEEVHLKSNTLSALPPIGEGTSPTQATAPTSSALDARSSRSDLPLISPAARPQSVPTSDDGTGLSEKSWKEKNWRERRNARFCGVPLWFLLAVLVFFVIIIMIAGAIIGGLLSHRNQDSDDQTPSNATSAAQTTSAAPTKTVTSSSTGLIDAEPINTTPTYVATLPSGLYILETGGPTGYFSGCLPQNEDLAWSCTLPMDKVAIEIDTSGSVPMLSLMATDQDVWYGVQPPYIQNQPLNLVFDKQTPGYPMAYQFQTIYKKRVILREGDLNFNNSGITSRGFGGPGSDGSMPGVGFGIQDKQLLKNDEPWFCEWPQTFLEVMIYVGNGSSIMTNASTTLATVTSPKSQSTASSSPTSPSQTLSSPKQKRGQSTATSSSSSYSDLSIITPPSQSSAYSGYTIPPAASSSAPPLFPQMAKIEERRLKNSQGNAPMPPTCTQMTNHGSVASPSYSPKLINVNQIPVFKLDEAFPPIPTQQLQGTAVQKRSSIEERNNAQGNVDNGCYCAWNSPNQRAPPIGQSEAQYYALQSQGKQLLPGVKAKRWWLEEHY